jgi:hypothetical protein
VFTIAERLDKTHIPMALPFTSVTSQTMCDEASGKRSKTKPKLSFVFFEIDLIQKMHRLIVHFAQLSSMMKRLNVRQEKVIGKVMMKY